jgi:hypothetical protein
MDGSAMTWSVGSKLPCLAPVICLNPTCRLGWKRQVNRPTQEQRESELDYSRNGGKMKYIVSRVSWVEDKPCEGAEEEEVLRTAYCTCKTLAEARKHEWFTKGINQRVENGGTACDFKYEAWVRILPSSRCLRSMVI